MGVNKRVRHPFGFDGRHVTGDALASGAAYFVMRVFRQRGRVRAVYGRRSMTIQEDLVRGLSELSIVRGAVHVVARTAGDTVLIHHALREVIALHAVLVRGAVREVVESSLSQCA